MAKRKTTTDVTDKVVVNEEKVTTEAVEEIQQEEVTGATEPTTDAAEETQQGEVGELESQENAGDEVAEQTEEETEVFKIWVKI